MFVVKSTPDLEEVRLVLGSQMAVADEKSQPGHVAIKLKLSVPHVLCNLLNCPEPQTGDLAVADPGHFCWWGVPSREGIGSVTGTRASCCR